MATEDNKFIANGAAHFAFSTGSKPSASRIDYGVNVAAKHCGVFATAGDEFGRELFFPIGVRIGVWGDGVEGVHGRGSRTAIDKDKNFVGIGVFGDGPKFGVHGESPDVGVHGFTQSGRGGVFDCTKNGRAQVRLIPNLPDVKKSIRMPTEADFLPADGKAGDLLALGDDTFANLWFCEQTAADGAGAVWRAVQLGAPISGRRTFK